MPCGNCANCHSIAILRSNVAPAMIIGPTSCGADTNAAPETAGHESDKKHEQGTVDDETALASSSNATLREAANFQQACAENNAELAEYYKDKLSYRFARLILSRDNWKILRDAARRGDTEIAEWICRNIDPGTDMIIGTVAGGSPLREAWLGGHYELAKTMCESHAISYDEVRTIVKEVFIAVCEGGRFNIAIDMVDRFEGLSRPAGFLAACEYGHLKLAKALGLAAHDRPKRDDAVDALHSACEGGHTEVAAWVSKQWGLKAQDMQARGRRGIHRACAWQHTKTIMWIVKEFGADLDEDDFDRPEVLAALSNHAGLAQWIVEKIPGLRGKVSYHYA